MVMNYREYRDRQKNRLVHAKPSSVQPGIIVFQPDRHGKPQGRIMAATVDEFNEKYEPAARK